MKKFLFLICCLFLVGCSNSSSDSNEIDEVIKEGNSDYLIIDVRSREEYESGHLKNAINIDVNDIASVRDSYDLDKKIIVYCRSGGRSSKAFSELESMGYKNIYDLGGINNKNYELVKD